MNYKDKTLTCQDRGQPFIFSVDDQAFHTTNGSTIEPERCASCRQARRSERNAEYGQGLREMHPVVCAECGKETTFPSSPVATARSTAAIASANGARAGW